MDPLEDVISVRLISLPDHLFLHIKNYESQGYYDFWEKQEAVPGLDCDSVSQILDQIEEKLDGEDKTKGRYKGQVMARLFEEDATPEAYGIRLPADWKGEIPKGFLLQPIESTDYLVFQHGPFDFEKEADQVYGMLQKAMDTFSYQEVDFVPDISPGRLVYFYFDPDLYAKYLLPIQAKHA